MLDHKGFDLWEDGYDKPVGVSDEMRDTNDRYNKAQQPL